MKHSRWRTTGRRGSALVMSLIAVTVFGTLTLSMLQLSMTTSRGRASAESQSEAQLLAESAFHEAATAVLHGGFPSLGSPDAPLRFGDGLVWTEATEADGLWTIRSTGMADSGRARIEGVVQLVNRGVIASMVRSRSRLHLHKDVFIDSYDPTLGDYDSQAVNEEDGVRYAGAEGDLVTDANLLFSHGLQLFGDAVFGSTYEDTLEGKKQDVVHVGEVRPSPRPMDLVPVTPPSAPPSLGDLRISGDKHSDDFDLVLGPGTFHFDDFEAGKHSRVKLVGPASIVLDGSFDLSGSIVVDGANGPVGVYVAGDAQVDAKGSIETSTSKAGSFALMVDDGRGGSKTVEVSGRMTGVIYSPFGRVELRKHAEMFGAIIGDDVRVHSDSRLHYDESLGTEDNPFAGAPAVELISLRVIGLDEAAASADRRDASRRFEHDDLRALSSSWEPGARVDDEEPRYVDDQWIEEILSDDDGSTTGN